MWESWDIAMVDNIVGTLGLIVTKGFTTYAPHMSYENFMEIVKQAAGKTFQIALGGAGDLINIHKLRIY